MAGLADLTVATETVHIQGEDFDVHGLNMGSIGKLLQRFPEFGKLAANGKLDPVSLMSLGPEFFCAFLAAGLDRNWTVEVEQVIALLSIDEQMQIFSAVLKLSMPRGIGPFVKTVEAVAVMLMGSNPASNGGKPKSGSTPRKRSSP